MINPSPEINRRYAACVAQLREEIEHWLAERIGPTEDYADMSAELYGFFLSDTLLELALSRDIRLYGVECAEERMKACFERHAGRHSQSLQ